MGAPNTTPGEWVVNPFCAQVDCAALSEKGGLLPVCQLLWPTAERTEAETSANSHQIAASGDLYDALAKLADVFAHEGENSIDRFERLASMFRKDTGFLAPGKDQPMSGPDQPDGDELRAIYDDWYVGKVRCARAALAKAEGRA